MNGTWTLYFSWGCNGSYGQTALTLNNDGSFKTDDGGSGNWAQVGGMVDLLFNVGESPSYAGNTLGSSATGMILTPGGATGCWYAISEKAQIAALGKSDRTSAGGAAR